MSEILETGRKVFAKLRCANGNAKSNESRNQPIFNSRRPALILNKACNESFHDLTLPSDLMPRSRFPRSIITVLCGPLFYRLFTLAALFL
ncbi:hypothetical protein CBM2585_B50026 [Cupriavidus taiwanensis]|nr:hypothetical protein CBM2585_B50026 [Cupriavidus taiwanensis]SPC19233.1 hypothetical protein CT19431_MP40009 [Cupriavidus taiwanensis]